MLCSGTNSICTLKGHLFLGVLMHYNFWRRYLHHTHKNFSKSLCIFFSRLPIVGEPPESGSFQPSLFMAGIRRNTYLNQLYWSP